MLTRLVVENFALAERAEIGFEAGFIVLTGETGAGKSLLVDALSFLERSRGAGDFIRTGCETAVIEATFRCATPEIDHFLDERGIERDGDEVTLRRVLTKEGRHRIFVNGAQVPAAAAAEIAAWVLEIHGQHEQQRLLEPTEHLRLLDEAAGNAGRLDAYLDCYRRWKEARSELDALRTAAQERERRLDFVRYQIEELERVAPTSGEWEELDQERKRLGHAEKLLQVSGDGEEFLYGGENPLAPGLRSLAKRLEEAAKWDPEFAQWAAEANELAVRSEELARSLGGYASKLEVDPRRLDAINSRLDDLDKLRRKYGDLAELTSLLEKLRHECGTLENSDAQLARLEKLAVTLEKETRRLAQELHQSRVAAAEPFTRRLATALQPLGMPEASLQWRFETLPNPGPSGQDQAELLLSANRGEPPKPLNKVASGGELSRVMLALHTVALEDGGPGCVVFDEIDAGIGGDVGNAVGAALRRVAERRQVICVTHLAQIAAQAGTHWQVVKSIEGKRTVSQIHLLGDKQREEEIGRMLGGKVDDASRRHASALLQRAGS